MASKARLFVDATAAEAGGYRATVFRSYGKGSAKVYNSKGKLLPDERIKILVSKWFGTKPDAQVQAERYVRDFGVKMRLYQSGINAAPSRLRA